MISVYLSLTKNNGFLRAKNSCGFTLFELVIVVAIVATLGAILLNRIVFYQDKVELAAVNQLVGTLRGALRLHAARLVVAGRHDELPVLAGENPMSLLAEKPGNYAGEYFHASTNEVPPGHWYFDRTDRKLVYLLSGGKNFQNTRTSVLKFKVNLASPSAGLSGSSPAALDVVVLNQVGD